MHISKNMLLDSWLVSKKASGPPRAAAGACGPVETGGELQGGAASGGSEQAAGEEGPRDREGLGTGGGRAEADAREKPGSREVIGFYGHRKGKKFREFSNFYADAPSFQFVLPIFAQSAGLPGVVTCECSEKAIMLTKAALMGDATTFRKIKDTQDAAAAKQLGRKVKPWDEENGTSTWRRSPSRWSSRNSPLAILSGTFCSPPEMRSWQRRRARTTFGALASTWGRTAWRTPRGGEAAMSLAAP